MVIVEVKVYTLPGILQHGFHLFGDAGNEVFMMLMHNHLFSPAIILSYITTLNIAKG
jgi:hypothetical protein